ncbi:Rne/Rng family ribonuclease [Humibacter ginsenosidimutans]|uniref:Ribonuclease E n=1 Tax=Humibacter ginsenosidimutans TaxID=2599293 RepID=A0A5B8LZQ5_9MICO|nr:Rne/Rng family ribonuclease [Humibacter ginsenosidimutans]QDZ13998.1 Rne/Rng family ribonuclease [Humibacter ginsenosidimutans]
MVENDQNSWEESHGTEGAAPRKRGRLFGGRRGTRKTEPEVQAAAPEGIPGQSVEAPATNAVVEQPAAEQATAEATSATTVEIGRADDVAETEAQAEASDEPAAQAASAAHAAQAPGLPSTALLFQAPPVLAPPPVAAHEETAEREEGTSRKRTRRRGGSGEGQDEAPRRQREPELITEPQKVKGSTRLEAKKQRRRDGRDAGRRRPVITEAEFLARREAVDRQMIVRSKGGRIQIGVLEDGVLVEHYVARSQEASLIGNVYLGRVQNVLPSMEAAFVDIGRGRNAVLYSGEVDWDAAETGNQPRRIELALKSGDKVLVQVTKDPVGHKGARLTSQVSLPGRYLVYVPNGSMNGISRKLPDTERARLKKILKEVLPENTGVIVRTAAEGATQEQLTVDVNRLTAQWADISKQAESVQAPALLHSEPDLLIKIVRDVFNEDFQKMIIAGDDARQTIESYLRQVAPDLLERVEAYEGQRDAFDEFRITEQIEKALDRKVWLPSGGSLVIDRTEAMTVVDVNTGKFVGSGGNLEETVTKNNLEAAEEIVRQLRLRDIGGIIVVDFIDMVLESNRDLVLRRLVECLSRDRTKHQVAEVTSLGLVQMTRKKLGLGLLETFSEPCEVCAGRGVIVHHDPVTKHRAPQPPERRRGGKTGATASANSQSTANGHAGTHEITDDAKNALAQIAASTLHPHPDADAELAEVATEATGEAASGPKHRAAGSEKQGDGVAVDGGPNAEGDEKKDAPRSRRGGRGRGRRGSGNGTPNNDEAVVAETPREPETSAEVPVAVADEAQAHESVSNEHAARADDELVPPLSILDIPVQVHAEPAARVDREQAKEILGSVLDALPEPKQPGQGRSRRRVTTAGLTGGTIAPAQDDAQHA